MYIGIHILIKCKNENLYNSCVLKKWKTLPKVNFINSILFLLFIKIIRLFVSDKH